MKKIFLFSAVGIVPIILYMFYLNNKDEQNDDEKEVEEDFKVDDSKDFATDNLPVGGKKESDDIKYVLSDTPSEEEKEEPALEDRLYSTDLAEKLKIATSTARRRLASTKAVKLVHFDTKTNRPYILKSDFKKFKKLFEVKK